MAEIKIEKKAAIWPWILLGVLLLALLIYFLTRDNDAEATAETAATTQTSAPAPTPDPQTGADRPQAVKAYLDFVSVGNMDETHEYTNGALVRLANAIEAKANQVGYNVQSDLTKVREAANQITQDKTAETHANQISQAANTMAGVLVNMQQATFPKLGNEAEQVKQAANAIKPGALTLEQKGAVRSFFESAAQLLRNMNQA